jgi:hypothetical protein
MATQISTEHVDKQQVSVYSTTLSLNDIREFVVKTQDLSGYAHIVGLDREGKPIPDVFGLRASVTTYLPE